MKMKHHYLSEKQLQRLKKVSEDIGITVSELIRRAIDEWLDKHDATRP